MNPAQTIPCSDRLGEIPGANFQAALDRFGLGQFLSAEPVRFGNFGQNVFITSTSGVFVFRGAPHDDVQFPKERFFAEHLHNRTRTPVPWPYRIDDSLTIFKWPYVIMPRMPGAQLADSEITNSLGQDDWLSLASAMGELVAEMQKLTWPFCGEYDGAKGTVVPLNEPYADWFFGKMRWFLGECRKYPRTTGADIRWVEQLLQQSRNALEVPFQPNFVMQDLNISNLTAEKSGTHWKITGVFDLAQSFFGNGEQDLAGLATLLGRPELMRAYFASYLAHHHPHPGFEDRLKVYMLLQRLTAWYWGNETRKSWLPKDGCFRDWAEQDTECVKTAL